MFLQQATPDTSGYMIAGYVIAFVVMAIYVASMYIRNRNLKQDMTLLEEMDKVAQQQTTKPKEKKSTKTATKGAKKK